MKILIGLFSLLFISTLRAEAISGNFGLQSSRIEYTVTYLIKKAQGTSVSAKGKGECKETCEFLVAAPVKSFESKDSNRDLNMLKVTKAEKFPLIVVKVKTKNQFTKELLADLEIEFAGEKHLYKNVAFVSKFAGNIFHVEGKINLSLDDFKVEKPSLMGVDINSIVPIEISADWKKE